MSKYLTMAERGTAFADIMRMRQSHEPRMGGDDPREEAKRRRAAARAEDALRGHADEAEALLLEVAAAGVVLDDPRIGYVEIQVDRETWQAIRAAVGAKEEERDGS